jgi:hypothetical protein
MFPVAAPRLSLIALIRFWVIKMKVDREIASTDAIIASFTNSGSHGVSPSHPRLAATHKP